jgi:putative peptide zinc metalloprotease protein
MRGVAIAKRGYVRAMNFRDAQHSPSRRRALVVLTIVVLALSAAGLAGASYDPSTSDPSAASVSTESAAPVTTSPEETSQPAHEGGGGGNVNNEVVVINTNDGRFADRSGFGVARVTGEVVENQNAAAATSSCIDCRTVAVAVQIVLVQRDASTVAPRNLAIALNIDCTQCETFAAAHQYVITTNGLVRFTPEGQQQLASLQGQIRALAATDGIPFPDLDAQIDALVEQMWAVVDNELLKAGKPGSGTAYQDTDTETGTSSPSPTASDSVSPSDAPSETPSEVPTEPAATETTTPTSEPSPSESESSTTSESPSPSPSGTGP